MPVRLRTKRRGYHQQGLKLDGRTPSLDLCPCCLSFHCDPMSMSDRFHHKIRERQRKHLCPTCGNPIEFCRCRSTLDPSRAGRPVQHNNKRLRAAIRLVNARERAYLTWSNHEERLIDTIGETAYSNISNALYHHNTPSVPWPAAKRAVETCGIDISILYPAWSGRA